MMRLEEAKIMVSDDTKKQKDASSPAFWFGNLPQRIQPDEVIDSRLAGFPANQDFSESVEARQFPPLSNWNSNLREGRKFLARVTQRIGTAVIGHTNCRARALVTVHVGQKCSMHLELPPPFHFRV
jgi:hypothetical protein